MVGFTQAGAIDRMLQGASGEMSHEVAQSVLQWRFAESDQTKVAELSAKARLGNLSTQESSELDWYLLLGDFLSVVQSRARVALANNRVTR